MVHKITFFGFDHNKILINNLVSDTSFELETKVIFNDLKK